MSCAGKGWTDVSDLCVFLRKELPFGVVVIVVVVVVVEMNII